jgi:hypothetical protein
MADACKGDVGRIEGRMATGLATGNDQLNKEAMGEMMTAYMNGRKNLPAEIKACNMQRVKEDGNHPYLQTLQIE